MYRTLDSIVGILKLVIWTNFYNIGACLDLTQYYMMTHTTCILRGTRNLRGFLHGKVEFMETCPLGSWVSLWNFETIRGSLVKPKWQKLACLAQEICTL